MCTHTQTLPLTHKHVVTLLTINSKGRRRHTGCRHLFASECDVKLGRVCLGLSYWLNSEHCSRGLKQDQVQSLGLVSRYSESAFFRQGSFKLSQGFLDHRGAELIVSPPQHVMHRGGGTCPFLLSSYRLYIDVTR